MAGTKERAPSSGTKKKKRTTRSSTSGSKKRASPTSSSPDFESPGSSASSAYSPSPTEDSKSPPPAKATPKKESRKAKRASANSRRPNSLPTITRPLLPQPYFYYIDHSQTVDPDPLTPLSPALSVPNFVMKLHAILIREDMRDVVWWLPHGRSWKILDQTKFELKVLPLYFQQSSIASFYRQANGWGFRRMLKGPDKGSFYNERFIRGLPYLCKKMKRIGGAKMIEDNNINHEPILWKISAEHPPPAEVPKDSLDYLVLDTINNCVRDGGPKAKMPLIHNIEKIAAQSLKKARERKPAPAMATAANAINNALISIAGSGGTATTSTSSASTSLGQASSALYLPIQSQPPPSLDPLTANALLSQLLGAQQLQQHQPTATNPLSALLPQNTTAQAFVPNALASVDPLSLTLKVGNLPVPAAPLVQGTLLQLLQAQTQQQLQGAAGTLQVQLQQPQVAAPQGTLANVLNAAGLLSSAPAVPAAPALHGNAIPLQQLLQLQQPHAALSQANIAQRLNAAGSLTLAPGSLPLAPIPAATAASVATQPPPQGNLGQVTTIAQLLGLQHSNNASSSTPAAAVGSNVADALRQLQQHHQASQVQGQQVAPSTGAPLSTVLQQMTQNHAPPARSSYLSPGVSAPEQSQSIISLLAGIAGAQQTPQQQQGHNSQKT